MFKKLFKHEADYGLEEVSTWVVSGATQAGDRAVLVEAANRDEAEQLGWAKGVIVADVREATGQRRRKRVRRR